MDTSKRTAWFDDFLDPLLSKRTPRQVRRSRTGLWNWCWVSQSYNYIYVHLLHSLSHILLKEQTSIDYPVSQGSIFQMRICPANLLLISLSASDSFKRFSGEKNTSMMLSSFLTLPLLWLSFDMCGTFRLQDLWSVTLDFSWFALGLFRFWFSIGFCDCEVKAIKMDGKG